MNIPFKIALNSGFQFLARLISTLSILGVTFLITQNLSKQVWGDFVAITSYIAIFSLVVDFGLNGIIVKLINAKEETEKYIENLFGLRILLAIFSIFLALAVLSFLPHSSTVKFGIIVGLFMLVAQGVFNTAGAVFQKEQRYDKFAFADILGSLTIFLLSFIAVNLRADLSVLIAIFAAGTGVKAVIGFVMVAATFEKKGILFDFGLWKSLIISALPLGLVMVFSQINANIDKQIIALSNAEPIISLGPSVAIAVYGLAYRFFDFAIAIPGFIVNSSYPVLLEKQKENKETLGKDVSDLTIAMFILGGVLAIFGWLVSPMVINIFGDYQASVLPLRILLLGLPFFFISALFLWVTVTINKEKVLPFIYLFATLFNIVANLIFIPNFGYNAAAVITVVTEILVLALLFLLINSEIKIFKKYGSPQR